MNRREASDWAQQVSRRIKEKVGVVAARSQGIIPFTSVEGRFDDWTDKNLCWWTNGFWAGEMWQLYNATKDPLYLERAQEIEKKLDGNLMNAGGLDHDNGFKWLLTAAADYRITGSKESRNRALLAADNLAGRFNPAGRFIRAWNDGGDGSRAGWAIIDCMMNLPLLYWAYRETKDPRYLQIATLHADTAERFFIREDGSANHIVEFNPATGEFVRTYGGQGYGEGSSWTRGQSWALYGFTLSYLHTGEAKYLNTAKRVANYFIANIPENGLIPVDFRQPLDCALEDSTAAAIASCGLLELSRQLPEPESTLYHRAALRLLTTLERERCNWDLACDHIVEKGTGAFHDERHEYPIIYGDYYFVEAVWKLTGEESFMW